MKKIVLPIIIFSAFAVNAQNTVIPTDHLKVEGKVKNEMLFSLSDLDTFKKTTLGDVAIISGTGQVEQNSKEVKGILLKDLFQKIEFQAENHKALNKFYVVFSASDGFKLVLSRNEIFHTNACNNFYLITDMDGKKINELDQRILIMEIADSKTGHKRIEGLEKIVIKEAE